MGIKFFGQYLIESGEVDAVGLRAALGLMELENLTVGELAVRAGFASESDCRRVNGEQRRLDRPFGELAREMGVLNSVELEELLQSQLDTRIGIGDALVRLELLTRDHLSELEDLFKRDQAGFSSGGVVLPEALAGNRAAGCVVEMLPRYLMRLARLDAVLGDAEPFGTSDAELKLGASLVMVGNAGLEIHLLAAPSFARKLTAGIVRADEDSLSAELCLDGLGEFLNVLAGNTISSLESRGLEFRMEAPSYGRTPREGWCFDIASNWGKASLVLDEP